MNREEGLERLPTLEGPPPPSLLLFKHFPQPEVTDKIKPEWLPFIKQLAAKEGRREAHHATHRSPDHESWIEDLQAQDSAWDRQIDARSSAWRSENPQLEAQARLIDASARRHGAEGVNFAAGVKNVLTHLVVTLRSILDARRNVQSEEPAMSIDLQTGATTIVPQVEGHLGANQYDIYQILKRYGVQSGLGEVAADLVAPALLRDIAARNIPVGDLRVDTEVPGILTIRLPEPRYKHPMGGS